MYEKFLSDRIYQLYSEKNMSARGLSLDIGHSEGYINTIVVGASMPSMSEFFEICRYFNITPSQFFDENNNYPPLVNDIFNELKYLNSDTLKALLVIIEKLHK